MKKTIFALALVASTATGCSSLQPQNMAGDVYNTGAQAEQTTRFGRIVDLRRVTLQKQGGAQTALAQSVGGVLGALLGAQVAHGGNYQAQMAGSALGGAAGAFAGSVMASSTSKADGIEVSIRFSGDEVRTVAQENNGEKFSIGECVRVIEGSVTRVTAAGNAKLCV